MCRLKTILSITEETGHILAQLKTDFEVADFANARILRAHAEAQDRDTWAKSALLLAATDETIALGKELAIATLAYANPSIPNQSYRGVEMLVEGFEEVDADFLEKVYQRYHHLPWTIVETKRCIVRELCLADMDALFALYDEEVCRYTESLYPYPEELEFQRAYINHMYRFFGYGMWLVFSKETGALIGRAGLEHREYDGETELELGYLIGTKYQRRGYAFEVCKAILGYAKENVGFSRINTLIEAENIASIRLSEKLGFVHKMDYSVDGKKLSRFCLEF